jgi:hypothetical protein
VRLTDMDGARGNFNTWRPSVTIRSGSGSAATAHLASTFAWATARSISPSGESWLARALWVSGDAFSTLGVNPILGRTFIG